jgi:hypothetical protein
LNSFYLFAISTFAQASWQFDFLARQRDLFFQYFKIHSSFNVFSFPPKTCLAQEPVLSPCRQRSFASFYAMLPLKISPA